MKKGKGKEKNVRGDTKIEVEQPKPFTPGITKAQVRQHAYELYRDKLGHGGLSLQDWVLAEKDLVSMMQTGEVVER